jgi:hypothetical protein
MIGRLLVGAVGSLTAWHHPGGPLSADDPANALVATTFDFLRTG